VDLAPLEVRRLTADIGELFRAQARAKGLALEIRVANDVPEWVETDAVKVRQVVTNLVGNALKFTERGGVSLLVTCVRDGTDAEARTSLEIAVADTGVGITPELQESVFEPFVQAEASISRLHGGTGLGLAIARELARLLGGGLTLRSARGEGSTFTLSVPARQVAAPSTPAATGPAVAQAGADSDARTRVLLVEDNALNRTVATRMLARLGADVTVAENGIQAIRLASSERFDLVLMDLQMPVMDGITAASTIRACEAMAGLPPVRIVAMTGNAPEDYADDCAEAGMNGFVVKPVDLAGLEALLHGVTTTAGDDPAQSSEPGRAAASA
jgi:CheY-like chemotaxis protein